MDEKLFIDAMTRLLEGQFTEEMLAGTLAGGAVMSIAVFLVTALIGFALCLWCLKAVSNWIIFKKMGEKGWKAFIPYYSDYILYSKIWNTKMFWIVTILSIAGSLLTRTTIPAAFMLIGAAFNIAFIVLHIRSLGRLSRAFGHGKAFAAGLFFFNTVFSLILALGNSEYKGNNNSK